MEFEINLHEALSNERLQRIQKNLASLSDNELTIQAMRLEMAVCKLTNRGFDKVAEDFCSEYGLRPDH